VGLGQGDDLTLCGGRGFIHAAPCSLLSENNPATGVRRTSRLVADTPPPVTELSNYQMLERRSRELAAERAHGGFGASQPPEAEKPLLFPTFCTMAQMPQSTRQHTDDE
jgi:hypothetical protein